MFSCSLIDLFFFFTEFAYAVLIFHIISRSVSAYRHLFMPVPIAISSCQCLSPPLRVSAYRHHFVPMPIFISACIYFPLFLFYFLFQFFLSVLVMGLFSLLTFLSFFFLNSFFLYSLFSFRSAVKRFVRCVSIPPKFLFTRCLHCKFLHIFILLLKLYHHLLSFSYSYCNYFLLLIFIQKFLTSKTHLPFVGVFYIHLFLLISVNSMSINTFNAFMEIYKKKKQTTQWW